MELLASIRATLAAHPLVPFAAVVLLLLALHRRAVVPMLACVIGRVATASAVMILFGFTAVTCWYAAQLAYFDAAEPTITAVAAVLAAGKPLYPALDAPDRYAHVYGPVLFIVHAGALTIGGPSIVASKVVGVAAVLASLLGLALIVAPLRGWRCAVWAAALSVVVYLAFGNVTFWTRSDPLLILCVVGGLAAARSRRWVFCVGGVGLCAGLALNLKVTGPLYLLPAVVAVWVSHGWRAVAGIATIAVVIGAAPFALPNVSLLHYLQYLHLSAANGLVWPTLARNIEWAVFLCAPLLGVIIAAWRSNYPSSAPRRGFQDAAESQPETRAGTLDAGRWTLEAGSYAAALSLAGAAVAVAIAAAKPGGGPFHLLPFVPSVALLFVTAGPALLEQALTRIPTLAVAAVALLIAIPQQIIFVTTVRGRDLHQARAELRSFMREHPSTAVAVGYAGTSHLSYVRPEAVFQSGDYLLDAPAVQEHQLAGLPIPAATLDALAACRSPVWLIPAAAGEPFLVPSAYPPRGPATVFSVEFRKTFLRHYHRTSSTGLFDVWTCLGAVTAPR